MSDKVKYVLEVDDKGSPKLLKIGANAEKAGKQTKKAFDGAGNAVSSFSQQLPGVGGALSAFSMGGAAAAGIAVGALAIGFGAAVKNSIDFADKMAKLSIRLGVSTEQLSVLAHMADLSGTDIDALADGMGKLGDRLSKGDKAIQKFGITAGTADEALYQLADRIAGTEDPLLRLEIATAAFGRSGQKMLPMLVQGGDKLREMSEHAPIVTAEMAKMSEQFNDTFTDITCSFAAVGIEIATSLLPYLQSAANLMKDIAKSMRGGVNRAEVGAKNSRARADELRGAMDLPGMSDRERRWAKSRYEEQDKIAREWEAEVFSLRQLAGGPGGMGGYRGEDKAPRPNTRPEAPPGQAVRPIASSVDYWSIRGNDLGNAQYAHNQAMSRRSPTEAGDKAENVDFLAMQPDYYAGLPVSEKAKASMEAQYDEEREKEDQRLEQRRAEMASFYAGVTGDMKGAFASAYADIWKNGRDAASALYDAFSERFTDRLIDSLASLSANGLMALLTGGSSVAGQGAFSLLGFAGGGSPPVGSPSIVGERRAETIIPRGPSRVEPTSGRGDTYNITVSNPAEARSLVRTLRSDERKRNTGVR